MSNVIDDVTLSQLYDAISEEQWNEFTDISNETLID